MRLEQVERRVLGAVSFVDATTGARLRSPLAVSGGELRFLRNRSGLYVVLAAPTLAAYTGAFAPTPPMPPLVHVAVTVTDPSDMYLARRFTLDVPRDPSPALPMPANSVFQPVVVRLFPAPAAPVASSWAVVRGHVKRGDVDLAGALVRVIRKSNGARLGTGIADRRGEVLVTVPGIPLVNWDQGAGPVMASQIDVSLETVFDPNATAPPDPDSLDALAAASTTDGKLGAGQELTFALTVPAV